MSAHDSPASPCTGVCSIDAADICVGCRRSLAEIGGWSSMSAAEKSAVMDLVEARSDAAE